MRIHAYFKPIKEIGPVGQQRLIDLWKQNWSGAGFEPVIIGPPQAEAHPLYPEYSRHVIGMPMMNYHTPAYDHSCFFRWLAMAQVGGGLMADYDCFNAGFKPEEVEPEAMTIYEPPHVPCLVSGSKSEFERVVKIFMDFRLKMYKQWLLPHSRGGQGVSDMLILANHSDQVKGKDIVREWTKDGVDKAKAIHFATSRCGPNKIAIIESWTKTRSTSSSATGEPRQSSTGTCQCGSGSGCR